MRLCVMRMDFSYAIYTRYFLLDRFTHYPYVEDGMVWYSKTDAEAEAKRQSLARGERGEPGWVPILDVKPKAPPRRKRGPVPVTQFVLKS